MHNTFLRITVQGNISLPDYS